MSSGRFGKYTIEDILQPAYTIATIKRGRDLITFASLVVAQRIVLKKHYFVDFFLLFPLYFEFKALLPSAALFIFLSAAAGAGIIGIDLFLCDDRSPFYTIGIIQHRDR